MDFGYKKIYINGELIDANTKASKEIFCPATEQRVATIAWASEEDSDKALVSAEAGFKNWSSLSLQERTVWIHRLRDAVQAKSDLLREAIMYEMGKPWAATEEDVDTVINALTWYPEEMKRLRDESIPDVENTHSHYITSQPVGVVAAILAWNFPLLNLGFKLGPALAAGCSIIIKPSEYSPLSAYLLGEICAEINFPAGVINIICGETEATGIRLCKSKIPRLVTMIGSSSTGMKLMEQSATSIKRMSMELGGNAPAIVFSDADIDKAVIDLSALKYGNCGQICVSPNRIYVHKTVYKEFEEKFIAAAKKVKPGFGKDGDHTMGPLINANSRTRIEQAVKEAVQNGAVVLQGGNTLDAKGYFFEPTVLKNVKPGMHVHDHEVFGPVASLIEFDNENEVLQSANNTDAGLVAYIYTHNPKTIQKFSAQLEFGEIQINGFKYAIYLPHGGIKQSGIGKDCSHLALDDYLIKKRVTTQLS